MIWNTSVYDNHHKVSIYLKESEAGVLQHCRYASYTTFSKGSVVHDVTPRGDAEMELNEQGRG